MSFGEELSLLRELIQLTEDIASKAVVKPTGKTFGVFVDNKLTEGGFFSRDAAQRCADEYNLALHEAREQTGWCLYYDEDTKVGNTVFKRGQCIEGPYPNWTREEMAEQMKEFDAASRKNLKIGNKTVSNGFVKE